MAALVALYVCFDGENIQTRLSLTHSIHHTGTLPPRKDDEEDEEEENEEEEITHAKAFEEIVLDTFSTLINHELKSNVKGWRIWIETIAFARELQLQSVVRGVRARSARISSFSLSLINYMNITHSHRKEINVVRIHTRL